MPVNDRLALQIGQLIMQALAMQTRIEELETENAALKASVGASGDE